MKVFISWSGLRSQAVAQTLRSWLKDVIQALDPWISVEDINKGQQWGPSLAEELESTHAGVICLTPENLTAP
jgi:TIR domain